MQISSKCTYISDAGFYSLLWQTCKSHFTCASWRQQKQTCKKKHKPCIVAVSAKVKVQLITSKLSWTHKFSQAEMFSQEVKKQTELWICQFFYRVSVYYPFLVFVSKLANCFQPPAHEGSQIPAQDLHHTSSYESYGIIQTSKVLQCFRDRKCYNDFCSF